jgi:hypothetical protein
VNYESAWCAYCGRAISRTPSDKWHHVETYDELCGEPLDGVARPVTDDDVRTAIEELTAMAVQR